MRRKILVILVLLVLFTLFLTFAFATTLKPVTNLTAKGEMGQVRLTWNKVSGADSYLIYRQVGKSGAMSYRYITPNGGFLDKTASTQEFNFYRVFPCITVNNKIVKLGPTNRYVYAKALKPTYNGVVTGLKATSGLGHITVSWNKLAGANGYYIYRAFESKEDVSPFSFIKATTGNIYDDFETREFDWCFYRVYPYKVINGKKVAGKSNTYVYAKAATYGKGVVDLRGFAPHTGETGRAFLTWKPLPGADGYEVRSSGDSNKYITTNTSWLYTGLDTDSMYRLSVTPYVLVKGHKIFGTSKFVDVRPFYSTLAFFYLREYYSGDYEVGKHISAGEYVFAKDYTLANPHDSYVIHVYGSDGRKKFKYFGEDPCECQLVVGDVLSIYAGRGSKAIFR